jgi:hypothetical protein
MIRSIGSSGGSRESRRRYKPYAVRVGMLLASYELSMVDVLGRKDHTALAARICRDAFAVLESDPGDLHSGLAGSRKNWISAVVRRLVPGVVLAGVAIALGYLPVIRDSDQRVGIQITLLVAGAVSVVAGDSPTRMVFDTLRDLSRKPPVP